MSEIHIVDPTRLRAGVKRIGKATLTIDMTPMVDLGFLLISFFIFTTEISKPALTNLYMPTDGDPTPIPGSRSLTFLLSSNNNVFYYGGDMTEAIKAGQVFKTSYDEIKGIGSVIRQKRSELMKRGIDKKGLTVLIKPGTSSSYKNVISALDEMLINGITRYAIIDQEEDEKRYLDSLIDRH